MSEGAQPHSATSRYPQWMQTTQNALRATGELSTRAIVAVFSLPGLSHACNAWDKFQTPFLRSPQYTPRGLGAAALTGLCLGLVGASAVWLAVIFPAYWNIFAFVACMCLFHWNEFMLQGLAHPEQLTTKSFLLTDSIEMRYAVRAAVVEYLFELWLFPSWKLAAAPASVTGLASSFCLALRVAASVGLVLALAGQFVRSAAMWTAGVSFTHLVAHHKRPEHVLITSGVYAWSRHPSYAGWFVWAVALQAMLLNPFCLVAYAAVAWKFFDARIRDEEEALIRFFGEDYRAYMRGVPTRIPLIK